MPFKNLFSTDMIDGYQLNLRDQKIPLLAGEVHFFRMDTSVWERSVEAIKVLGLPMISTYLSWRRFEKIEGIFDFKGTTDPRLNLKAFLEICQEKGVYVILKPGPWICAEETNGGYPDWLVERKSLQVLDADGNVVLGYNPPFNSPIPSLFHQDYWEALTRWLKAVDDFVRPFIYPSGPIVLMQLDNEPCYTFHDRFLESDYNPVITGPHGVFKKWLEEKYSSIDELKQVYGLETKSVSDLKAPRTVTESSPAALLRDWTLFKEWSLAEHVNRIGLLHRKNGIEKIPFTINFNLHPQLSTPNNWALLEQASGLGGFDYYPELPMRWSFFTRMVMAVTYSRLINKIPWSPEMMTGIWSFEGQPNQSHSFSVDDYRYLYFTCLAYGLKGMNFYMLADRDNWIDSPINGMGEITEYANPVFDVVKLIRAHPNFLDYRPVVNLALLFNHDHAREAYYLNETPSLLASSSGARAYKIFEDTFDFLLRKNITPALVDPEVHKISVIETPILIVVVSGHLSSELLTYLAEGGTLICITLDGNNFLGADMRPNFHLCNANSLHEKLTEILLCLNINPTVPLNNPKIISVVQKYEEAHLLFLINSTDEEQAAEVQLKKNQVFQDFFDCERQLSKSKPQIVLRPRSVRVYRSIETEK
ncbi:MAG TPA: beta-galactosidase [Anaerolineaceae bacterium]|nr:beta-galactosidase [Anaerolineaceae bacterium]